VCAALHSSKARASRARAFLELESMAWERAMVRNLLRVS
jgi:hypothetical protein